MAAVDKLFLTNLNPGIIDPSQLVDREEAASWLEQGLMAWLGFEPPPGEPLVGAAFCLLGEKGIGKSILTRKVVESVRQVHDATTVFLTVDCRPLRTQRDVLREAGAQLVLELARPSRKVSPELLADARTFDALSRFDLVSLRSAHEQVIQHKQSLELSSGSGSLASWISGTLGISMLRDRKTIDKLEGEITVDAPRVLEAFVQLLRDITNHSELRVILYIDNLEELIHESLHDPDRREGVRQDVEALMTLADAPVGLVLNMRTYYSSVLTRKIADRRTLGPLPSDEHLEIFARRLERERPETRAKVDNNPDIARMLDELATQARTPLGFLAWANHLLSNGLYAEPDRGAALRTRLESHYASVYRFLDPVLACFETPGQRVEAEVLRAACKGNDSLFRKLVDLQVLLPDDYWDPVEYYLDPELDFLLPPGS